MPKIDPNKKIQKQRTEQEMKKALEKLSSSGNARIIDVDDPDIILNDVIEELLEKRQIIEDIKNTAQSWLPKLARR